jgi:hypothetical protein
MLLLQFAINERHYLASTIHVAAIDFFKNSTNKFV